MWFDGSQQRTEHYVLYGVPFLRRRLRRLLRFGSSAELEAAILPFAEKMKRLHDAECPELAAEAVPDVAPAGKEGTNRDKS